MSSPIAAQRARWVPLLLLALAGCTDTAAGGGSSRCTINSECPLPEVCLDARCVLQCRVDSDCGDGEQCRENICVDPLAGCLSDADCRAFGLVCDVSLRRCVPTLADMQVMMRDGAPADADPGDRSLEPPILDAEVRTDARVRADASPPRPDAGIDPDAAPPSDAAVPVDAAPPIRGDARYGDPCRCAADCQSGFCLQNPYRDFGGQCSARCGAGVADALCPGIDRCVQARVPALGPGCPDPGLDIEEGDIVEVCAPNETGIPCRGAADCIIDGICITPPDPLAGAAVAVQAVCGARCANDRGCPAGFRCQGVPTQGGGQVDVCAAATEIAACPDGSNRSCGGVCPLGQGVDPLDVSYCLLLDAGPGGFCSCSCRNAGDCPLGFACSRGVLDSGDPARPGMCLPIAGYMCPQGAEACLSTFCAAPQGNDPFDRCTAPCTGPADCPQGYSCLRPPGAEVNVCAVQ